MRKHETRASAETCIGEGGTQAKIRKGALWEGFLIFDVAGTRPIVHVSEIIL